MGQFNFVGNSANRATPPARIPARTPSSRTSTGSFLLALLAGGTLATGTLGGTVHQPEPDAQAPKPAAKQSDAPPTPPPPAASAPGDAGASDQPKGDAQPAQADVPLFPVSKFDVRYNPEQHPKLPPMDQLSEEAMVSLVKTDAGYIAPTADAPGERFSVAELNRRLASASGGPPRFSPAALAGILVAMRDALVERGLLGVLVELDKNDIGRDPSTGDLNDERATGEGARTEVAIDVYFAAVTRLRTVAAGDAVRGQRERLDLPQYEVIKKLSPVQPVAEGSDARDELLVREPLDDYLLRLNRRPGRRVDVAVSNDDTERPGSVLLDYIVREADPLLLYSQVSNTGTKQTELWRERFGLIYNQVSGNNDSLSLDYVTGGFHATHVFNGSYELPLDDEDRLKLRATGTYSRFDASEVGRSNEKFKGETWSAGGSASYNIAQFGSTFIDVYGGARFEHVIVRNSTIPGGARGETDFLLPLFGARLERYSDEASTTITLNYEFNLPDSANTNQGELNRLGRLNTDRDWQTLQFSADQSIFLEPIFDAAAFRAGESTLAHEFFISFRGQSAFNYRLAPNFQQVAGGLYTVRGYPESASAGDNVYIGTVEYRFHLPRWLGVTQEPIPFFDGPFRYAPQQPYARPDWDLVFRTFLDVGRTENNQPGLVDKDQTLLGVGAGVELQFRRNINVRVDYGVALENVEGSDGVDRGDGRLHFVATFLF